MLPIRTFTIGNDISFCIADLRLERTKERFHSKAAHKKLISWIDNLNTPGVLVIPQPFIVEKGNKKDRNLPYWSQYNTILHSIEKGKHDIVVLAGDVHYGPISQVLVGDSKNKLTEIITSPLSNLSEINGLAANSPDTSQKNFQLYPLTA